MAVQYATCEVWVLVDESGNSAMGHGDPPRQPGCAEDEAAAMMRAADDGNPLCAEVN